MAAYVRFGQPGYRGMVRPHALWPISSEVGYDGLLAVAHHDGEVVAVHLGLGVRRNPHRGPSGRSAAVPLPTSRSSATPRSAAARSRAASSVDSGLGIAAA